MIALETKTVQGMKAKSERGQPMKTAECLSRMTLKATKAKDLMRPDPVSIAETATVREAVAFLVDKGFSAAPVIDKAGRPVGVLSRSDVLVHDREKVEHPAPEYYREKDIKLEGELADGFEIEVVDRTSVGEIMTPVVYSVSPNAPASEVIRDLLSLKVHRLFVVDKSGVLIGVISTMDVLEHLEAEESPSPACATKEYIPHEAEIW
jgi:CBS domain-containing protein